MTSLVDSDMTSKIVNQVCGYRKRQDVEFLGNEYEEKETGIKECYT